MSKLVHWLVILYAPLVAAAVLTGALAEAAPNSNYTSVEANSDKPVRIGLYGSAKKDCTAEPLPTIRVIAAPQSGMLTVRDGVLTTSRISGCPGLKIPVRVLFYRARAAATGADHLVYKVTNPTGEVGTYDVTITIKNSPDQVKPEGGSK